MRRATPSASRRASSSSSWRARNLAATASPVGHLSTMAQDRGRAHRPGGIDPCASSGPRALSRRRWSLGRGAAALYLADATLHAGIAIMLLPDLYGEHLLAPRQRPDGPCQVVSRLLGHVPGSRATKSSLARALQGRGGCP